MADVQLNVSPDVLKRKAEEVEEQIDRIEKNWNSLCETMKASNYYWEGQGGDRGRKLLEDSKEDVQKVLKRLKGHPVELLQMAGVYVAAEEQASISARALPENVID